jgi:hypothetical protein
MACIFDNRDVVLQLKEAAENQKKKRTLDSDDKNDPTHEEKREKK